MKRFSFQLRKWVCNEYDALYPNLWGLWPWWYIWIYNHNCIAKEGSKLFCSKPYRLGEGRCHELNRVIDKKDMMFLFLWQLTVWDFNGALIWDNVCTHLVSNLRNLCCLSSLTKHGNQFGLNGFANWIRHNPHWQTSKTRTAQLTYGYPTHDHLPCARHACFSPITNREQTWIFGATQAHLVLPWTDDCLGNVRCPCDACGH